MDKNERIELKRTELMQSFETLPAEKLKVAEDLIGQAAFMAVELEDLAEIISEEGMVEEYQNGKSQRGRKISSNAKMYSALIGKYNAIITRLLKIVPTHVETETEKLKRHELNAIQKRVEEDNFKTAIGFVNRAKDNSLDDVRTEIDDIWRETFFDYRETARIIKERGLYSE